MISVVLTYLQPARTSRRRRAAAHTSRGGSPISWLCIEILEELRASGLRAPSAPQGVGGEIHDIDDRHER
jgi:hypothetical protein